MCATIDADHAAPSVCIWLVSYVEMITECTASAAGRAFYRGVSDNLGVMTHLSRYHEFPVVNVTGKDGKEWTTISGQRSEAQSLQSN